MRLDIDTQTSYKENNDIHLLPLVYCWLCKIADTVLLIGFHRSLFSFFLICCLFVLKFSLNILQLLLFVMNVLEIENFKVCKNNNFLKIYAEYMLSLSFGMFAINLVNLI